MTYVIECSALFSSKSFIVSGLTLRSLIHFEFIFVYGVREKKRNERVTYTECLLHVKVSAYHQIKELPAYFSKYLSLF